MRIFAEVPGWQERAKRELGETPERRSKSLEEFKAIVSQITEFKPRLDEDFLLRFLRAKKFDLDRALSTYKRYFGIRLLDPERFMPKGKGPKDYEEAFKLQVGTLLEKLNPLDGTTTVIWRFGNWRPETGLDLRDIFTPTAMAGEFSLEDSQVQVNGVRFIIDLQKMQYSYVKHLSYSAIRVLVMALQDGYPVRFKGIHVLNNTALWSMLYNVVRPLLKEKQKQRFHLHGSDLNSLHKFIPKEILPKEYGGLAGDFSYQWLIDNLFKNHDKIVQSSYYGYL